MSARLRPALLALALLAPLGACSSVAEAVRGPELAPVGYPAALVPREQTIMSPREGPGRPAPTRCGGPGRGPSSPTSAPPRSATS
jgi:hypothetical protein